MKRARFMGAAVGMIVTVLVAACRQLVGIGDQPPAGGGVTCGGFAWSPDSCAACMQSSCCDAATTCRGDVVCGSVYDCLAACAGGDPACRYACAIQFDDPMAAVFSCQARSCAAACDVPCGGWFGVGAYSAQCNDCISTRNCTAGAALAQDEEFVAFQFCTESCLPFDKTCFDNCVSTHPVTDLPDGGASLVGALNAACADVCPLGGDEWACLSNVTWPGPSTSAITIRYDVVDYQSNQAISGATVRACSASDVDCTVTLATSTTDANGTAELVVAPTPFAGYLEVSAPGHVTDLVFVYPDQVASNVPPYLPTVGLATTSYFQSLVAATGIPYDATLGDVYMAPVDCLGNPAPGVSFSASPLGAKARPWYLVGGVPNGQATATVVNGGSAGGFVNVAPGVVTVQASENGAAFATASLAVRAGALTIVPYLVPTP